MLALFDTTIIVNAYIDVVNVISVHFKKSKKLAKVLITLQAFLSKIQFVFLIVLENCLNKF